MEKTEAKRPKEGLRHNEEKWGKRLMAAGWTAMPSVILERQRALGLDAVDLNILLHLARHWWYRENLPRPSKRAIADCMGIDPSTVRRRIAAMEKGGLIARLPRFGNLGQETNAYSFDGLIESATPFAEESIETRQVRKAEDEKRRTRKRPKLTLVTPK